MAVTYTIDDLPTLRVDLATCQSNKPKYEKEIRDRKANYDRENIAGNSWQILSETLSNGKRRATADAEYATALAYYKRRDDEKVFLDAAIKDLAAAEACIKEKSEAIAEIEKNGSHISDPPIPAPPSPAEIKKSKTTIAVVIIIIVVVIIIGAWFYRRQK